MSIDRSMRASDRDRDKAAEIVRDAYAAGPAEYRKSSASAA
jgi:hypothetical protein